METAFEEAKVDGYERLIASMTNDPKDRHVLAAAVHAGAHSIVTDNVRHFSPASTTPYHINAITPDDFLVQQFHVNDELLIEKLTAQAAARGIWLDQLLDRLQRHAPNCVRLLMR
jgi:hypothetical protein